jgi:hypothetical protein
VPSDEAKMTFFCSPVMASVRPRPAVIELMAFSPFPAAAGSRWESGSRPCCEIEVALAANRPHFSAVHAAFLVKA